MSKVLCLYYSRSGNTRKAMTEIAGALEAELVEIRDAADRSGWGGWLRCGMDSMRKTTRSLSRMETKLPLEAYDLVILGTPVWAGRCSSVMRAFLKANGQKLRKTAFVITRGSAGRNERVFDQMDLYVAEPHQAAVSLRSGSVGYTFWEEDFLRQVRELLGSR